MEKKLPCKEIIGWDTVNWAKALKLWEAELGKNTAKKTALEIGCREGGLSLWLAQKGISVVCSDVLSPEATVSPLHKKYNFKDNIVYNTVDATDIPYKDYFDVVVFKSVLGAVGRSNRKDLQIKAIQQMHKCLKDGGKLLFAENLVASPFHAYLRKKYLSWGRTWRYVSIEEMEEFLKIFKSVKIFTWGFLGAFGRNEFQRNVLGSIDSFLDILVPERWRYIIFGVAIK